MIIIEASGRTRTREEAEEQNEHFPIIGMQMHKNIVSSIKLLVPAEAEEQKEHQQAVGTQMHEIRMSI